MNKDKTQVNSLHDIILVRVGVILNQTGFSWFVKEYAGSLKTKRYEVKKIESDMSLGSSQYVAIEKLMHVDFNIHPNNQNHAYFMWCLPTQVDDARTALSKHLVNRIFSEYSELTKLKVHCDKISFTLSFPTFREPSEGE